MASFPGARLAVMVQPPLSAAELMLVDGWKDESWFTRVYWVYCYNGWLEASRKNPLEFFGKVERYEDEAWSEPEYISIGSLERFKQFATFQVASRRDTLPCPANEITSNLKASTCIRGVWHLHMRTYGSDALPRRMWVKSGPVRWPMALWLVALVALWLVLTGQSKTWRQAQARWHRLCAVGAQVLRTLGGSQRRSWILLSLLFAISTLHNFTNAVSDRLHTLNHTDCCGLGQVQKQAQRVAGSGRGSAVLCKFQHWSIRTITLARGHAILPYRTCFYVLPSSANGCYE